MPVHYSTHHGDGSDKPYQGAEKMIVSSPLGIEIIRLMGMVRRFRLGVYTMIMPPPEIAKGEWEAVEGSQAEHIETEAPPTALEQRQVHMFSLS